MQTRRRSRAGRWLIAALVLVLVALLIVWTQRRLIARDFVKRELERRGVQGSYEVVGIGTRTQRIERIVLGDPSDPDLTAEWAEVLTRLTLNGPVVTGVRAHGVRLKGRLIGSTVSLGQVDKLLPPPSGKPFTLPDLDVTLTDGRMRLDLPNGPVGLKLEGQGNLSDGFAGKLAAVAPGLTVGDCRLTGANAWLDLEVSDRRPAVVGPVRASGLNCGGGLALSGIETRVSTRLSEALDRWDGSTRLLLADARLGSDRLAGISGRATFVGTAADTKGTLDIGAALLAAASVTGERLRLEGAYTLTAIRGVLAAGLGGKANLARVSLDRTTLAAIGRLGGQADGTPAGPLLRALADAGVRAERSASVAADFTFAQRAQAGSMQLSALDVRSASGARLALVGDGVRYTWPGGRGAQVDGALTLSGGGFPATRIALDQAAPGAPIGGTATIAPFAAGGARLALTPVRFGPAGGATRFETQVTLDGPLADGRVTGLALPVSGRIGDGVLVNPSCAPLSWRSLSIAGLVLAPTRLTLCPERGGLLVSRGGRIGGGARVASPRLTGRLGQTPVTLAAETVRFTLGDGRLGINGLAARLGQPGAVTRLDIASLQGQPRGGGISGRFAGLGGQIARVPLIVSGAAGSWSLRSGDLRMAGGLRVADEMPEPRFAPMVSDNFALALIDGQVDAQGLLREARSSTAVTQVRIAHDLARGSGNAVLDVEGLTFDRGFQPDQLTRFSRGVVAGVRGSVTGRGNIRWTRAGVTSDGVFNTRNTDLAAAFGPVTAASTEIRFTDLLALETAPGQRVTLGAVNPGLAVLNGAIDYRLLPGQRVQIEGGRWPFAGGALVLEPTVLNFGVAAERRLVFKVEGVDLAQFVTELDLQDINATGIMDGTIPLVFDANGGRVEGGLLTVRPGGGTLAYVGQVSNADLGIWGDIAFDALKSIAYQDLTISLNGDIDGEMISEVKFIGVSRGSIEPVASGLIATIGGQVATQVQRLPFRFNIRLAAPLRELLSTARGLYDPKVLIERNPELIERLRNVQRPASEDKP